MAFQLLNFVFVSDLEIRDLNLFTFLFYKAYYKEVLTMKVAHIALIFSLFSTACLATNADENQQYRLQNAFPKLSFDNPVDLQHAGDGTNRIFVVSQKGLVYVFKNTPSVKSAKIF